MPGLRNYLRSLPSCSRFTERLRRRGGSTSSTSTGTTALSVASKVSVVDAKNAGGVTNALKLPKLYLTAIFTSTIPPASDYFKDAQTDYVHEGSAQALNSVNEILFMMAQTRYDAMVNRGSYKAQITNLYGLFSVNFKGPKVNPDGPLDTANPIFKGFMKTCFAFFI